MSKHYPLVYTFDDVFQGNGFVAHITAKGLCLMQEVPETGEVWIDGVTPAGFSAGGSDQKEATRSFKKEYQDVLQEIAEESKTSEKFEGLSRSILNQICHETKVLWDEAHDQVKRGETTSDWLREEHGDHAGEVKIRIYNLSQQNPVSNPSFTLDSQIHNPNLPEDSRVWSGSQDPAEIYAKAA